MFQGTGGQQHELLVRLAFFVLVFATMALWEIAAARRAMTTAKSARWFRNLSLVAIDAAVVRILFPAATVGVAWAASERGWGLLTLGEIPFVAAFIVSFLVFDLVVYLQHVVFHAVPALWRLHMVHHADLDFDVTTGVRFHPLEVLLSMLAKSAAVVVLGAPVLAVLTFEIALNATSMFNHSNVRMPAVVDGGLRWLLVTPDMHRVHHSALPDETNRNFGFNLTWWDRLLGTYRDQPRDGHLKMTIGLESFRDPAKLTLLRILALPFKGDGGAGSSGPEARGRTSPS